MQFSYLSVVSGVISEADYIFCPESPPPSDWPQRLCNKLLQAREKNINSYEFPYHKQWRALSIFCFDFEKLFGF